MDWFCKLSSRRSTTLVMILMVVLRAEGRRDGWPSSADVATTSSAVTCVTWSNCSWRVKFSLLNKSLTYGPKHITQTNTYITYWHLCWFYVPPNYEHKSNTVSTINHLWIQFFFLAEYILVKRVRKRGVKWNKKQGKRAVWGHFHIDLSCYSFCLHTWSSNILKTTGTQLMTFGSCHSPPMSQKRVADPTK